MPPVRGAAAIWAAGVVHEPLRDAITVEGMRAAVQHDGLVAGADVLAADGALVVVAVDHKLKSYTLQPERYKL